MNDIELRPRVLLVMQVALSGAATSDIRAVLCQWTCAKMRVGVIVDRDATDDEIESMSEVQTAICWLRQMEQAPGPAPRPVAAG